MQTGGLTGTENLCYVPDFNDQGIVIVQNCMNSGLGIRKMKNFSFRQRKSKFVGNRLKIQDGYFYKKRLVWKISGSKMNKSYANILIHIKYVNKKALTFFTTT